MHTTSMRCDKLPLAGITVAAIFGAIFPTPSLANARSGTGDRVFPSTMAVANPGIGDEANFQIDHQRVPGDDGVQSINTFDI